MPRITKQDLQDQIDRMMETIATQRQENNALIVENRSLRGERDRLTELVRGSATMQMSVQRMAEAVSSVAQQSCSIMDKAMRLHGQERQEYTQQQNIAKYDPAPWRNPHE